MTPTMPIDMLISQALLPLATTWGHWMRYISVMMGSAVKFVMGPVTGISVGLSVVETALFTTLGMMTTVVLLSSIGPNTRKTLLSRLTKKKRRLFTTRNRKLVRMWRKYGLLGVSILTPILLSPIVGALLAVSFGEKRKRIIYYMLFSSIAWAMVMSVFVRYMVDVGKYMAN